ncbi:MAG: TIGR00730 family Rossman fold protein [Bacteroidota bacterium]
MINKIHSVAVFCGSSAGNDPGFYDLAQMVGSALAERKIRTVYGGAKIGLMGAVADSALQNLGEVIGVLPEFMSGKEIAHTGLTELILVESMHQRKMKMHELSDAAIALPGGFGTMDELFELLTWLQLGLHANPIGILNYRGFYNDLDHQVKKMHHFGFLSDKHLNCLIFEEEVNALIDKMEKWNSPIQKNWLSSGQT